MLATLGVRCSSVRSLAVSSGRVRRATMATSAAARAGPAPFIVMDPFCLRSFLPPEQATGISIPCTPDEFTALVNEHYQRDRSLRDGYAPFCKHIFLPNPFAALKCSYMALTKDNEPLLRTEFQQRTEKELPVLTRFFPRDAVVPPPASHLDVILYSREQVRRENEAMAAQQNTATGQQAQLPHVSASLSSASGDSAWQWAIVSVKPQSVDHEVPMLPITMMRNALGIDEGGSGVKLDREQYQQSVQFWQSHATIQ